MAELKIRNITKKFAATPVLQGISFDVKDGTFVSLLGPSGCGKTTLLRIIAGLEEADGGELLSNGARLDRLAPAKRDIAMVFQNYALYPHFNVAENIGFALKLKGVARGERDVKVRAAARLLGIENFLARKPAALSGGQRQRVALARAIVREPKFFLLDEPLSNLDALLRERMRGELKMLFSQLRATVIYVTHDQTEALSMSDKIVLLKDGAIAQMGTPNELYSSPANLFAASFIGNPAMNLMAAPLAGALGINHRVKEDVVVGFRPEAVSVSTAVAAGALSCTVVLSEPMGAQTMWTLKVQETLFKAALPRNVRLDANEKAWISIPSEALHFFDAPTGNRLD